MQLIRSIAVASFIMFSFAACATEETTSSDDTEVAEPMTSTVESELAAACEYSGGCTDWNSESGCTQLTCCTVCGGGYRCMDFGTLGGEECVFYPRRF